MTSPDNTEHPNEEVQELTDENLEEVAGGIRAYPGVIGELTGADLTNDGSQGVYASFDFG
jgi:hypothetical protein